MRDNGLLKRLREKAKRGLRGWPLATIAFYGPNLSQATKATETGQPHRHRSRPRSRATAYYRWATAKALLLTFQSFGVSSSRSRRANRRSSAASTYTLLRALSFSRTVEPAHPLRIALAHARLHLGRLARGVTEVAETLQATVTRRLDEPTVMLGDLRVNQLSPDRL